MKTNVPFDKISKKLTRDINLSDSAYRLLVLIINNQTDWKINTTYYQDLLKWSNDKLSNATKNLIKLGYVKRTKINNGNKGFIYEYIINLDIEQKETITEALPVEVKEIPQPEEKAPQIEEKPQIEIELIKKPIQVEVKPEEVFEEKIIKLLEFAEEFNENYKGPKGRIFIINKLIKSENLKTIEAIENEFNSVLCSNVNTKMREMTSEELMLLK